MSLESYLYASLTEAQREEYRQLKEASLTAVGNRLTAWGRDLAHSDVASRVGHPALAGAGLGAFHGLVGGVFDARDEGKSWGDSLKSGLSNAVSSGVAGAGIGAGAGIASKGLGQRLTNFGKGTLHTMTGWTPKGGLASIGTGSTAAQKQLEQMTASGASESSLEAMRRHVSALQDVESKNLTNIPGLLKGVLDPSRTVDTMRSTKRMLLDGLDTQGKVLFGAGVASSLLPAILVKDVSLTDRAEMVARPMIGMVAGAPLQAATMQASLNPSALGGMLEGMAHNIPQGSVNRLMNIPVDAVASGVRHVTRPNVPPVDGVDDDIRFLQHRYSPNVWR